MSQQAELFRPVPTRCLVAGCPHNSMSKRTDTQLVKRHCETVGPPNCVWVTCLHCNSVSGYRRINGNWIAAVIRHG